MKREMKESVLADGEHENHVEDDGEGGDGRVAWHPDPLQVPGQLLHDLVLSHHEAKFFIK